MSVLLVPLNGKRICLRSLSQERDRASDSALPIPKAVFFPLWNTASVSLWKSLLHLQFLLQQFLKGGTFIYLFTFLMTPSCGWGLAAWECFPECFQQNRWLRHLPAFRLPNGQLKKPKVTLLRQSSSACASLKWFNVSWFRVPLRSN